MGRLDHADDTNGNDGRILTTAPGVGEQLHPDWAPQGSALTFAVDETDGTRDIWTASLDGSITQRIVDCSAPCAWTDAPAWSPDGNSIAFVRTVGDEDADGTSTVEVVDVATGVSAVVVSTSTTWYPFVPRWSPSGKGIVYESIEFASAMLAEERVLSATINVVDLMAPDPASVAITDRASGPHTPTGVPMASTSCSACRARRPSRRAGQHPGRPRTS